MRVYQTGDRVSQTQYGHGTVIRADQYHTRIDFDAHGLHTFSTVLVTTLAPSATVAPPKPTVQRRKRAAARP